MSDNYGNTLGIPARNHSNGWTVGELNNILENNLVQPRVLEPRGTFAPLEPFSGSLKLDSEL